jgi:chemotaxis protein MotB
MWLLGSTTEGDKKGISDYFQSPLKVALQGGPGAGSSNSIVTGGGNDLTQSSGQSRRGEGSEKSPKKNAGDQRKIERSKKDAQTLATLAAKIASTISNNPKMQEFSSQIKLEMTPDGLQIQITDDQKRPMFDLGSATVKPYMREILKEIGVTLSDVNNRISLDGHTDQTPYGNGARGYSNWELSADRANASRRELIAAGLPEAKLARVVGMASSLLAEPQTPFAAANRRISILVMTKEAEERLLGNAAPLPAEAEGTKPAP